MAGVALLLAGDSESEGWPEPSAWGLVLAVLAQAPVALRNRAPVTVFTATQIAAFWYVSLGFWPVVCTFGPLLALYTVASARPARVAVGCAAVLATLWVYGGVVSESQSMPTVVAQALLFGAVMVWFGTLARRSAELARRLTAEQAERARRAVTDERRRIARELHDIVAHHMSVVSVQTGLASFVFDSDPPTARAALTTIADTSREALDELRRMLSVLRDDAGEGEGDSDGGASVAPMPGLARLDDLVERLRAGGLSVRLLVEGPPRPLAPGVDLCAYRVVQEALTNVIKHAPGAAATVELRYRPRHVAVSVIDDGKGVNQDRVLPGGGHGLIGMRERAKLYGGTISIGPRGDGGFAVRLVLPTSAAARGGEGDPGA
ncbi:sensor histidine kinase [Streptomyces sp. 3MP-14]|uniref:histidine kinase n=1 Tax=Streptomyces mimosae TaxID=2586635 RepID=A0A5N6APF8_9ACTN|nr:MULTISPECIES: sensor histidine kinase [Streptomyces]KAB8169993.1 sensor histidine kinase [Streptomyces mimosae]KAB8178741.1 sensor histidine kinase [Streptomyces sp. 3MP-14]